MVRAPPGSVRHRATGTRDHGALKCMFKRAARGFTSGNRGAANWRSYCFTTGAARPAPGTPSAVCCRSGIDRLDRQFRSAIVRQQRDEVSPRDLLSEHERRPIGDTGARERRAKQHLGIVGRHPAGAVDNMGMTFRIGERPVSRGHGLAEREPRSPAQFVRTSRRTVPLQVVGGTRRRPSGTVRAGARPGLNRATVQSVSPRLRRFRAGRRSGRSATLRC